VQYPLKGVCSPAIQPAPALVSSCPVSVSPKHLRHNVLIFLKENMFCEKLGHFEGSAPHCSPRGRLLLCRGPGLGQNRVTLFLFMILFTNMSMRCLICTKELWKLMDRSDVAAGCSKHWSGLHPSYSQACT
jgi:hypothetical protein